MRRVVGRLAVSGAAAGSGRGGIGDLVQRVGDGAVVSGGEREGLLRQPPAGFAAQGAVAAFHLLDEIRVIEHAGDDSDVFKVFGGGTNHGRAADVDVFDEVAEGDAGLSGGLLKGVEIHHHHVDGLDAVGGDGGLVLLVAANVKQSAVDLGMEGLDAAVEHLRKAGEIADVLDGEAALRAELARCRRWRPARRQNRRGRGQSRPGRSCR